MFNIDISNHQNNYFTIFAALESNYFEFKFNYNAGFDFWSLAIYFNDSLILTTKIVCLFNFLAYFKYLSIPNGVIVFDTIYPSAVSYPTENDFIDKIVTMKYIPSAEL